MPTPKICTLKALKKSLKKSLPGKISRVIRSYEDFSEQEIPDDAKGFCAHHNACKSAVIHAETLLKLARWTSDDSTVESNQELRAKDTDILTMLDEAREDLNDDDGED